MSRLNKIPIKYYYKCCVNIRIANAGFFSLARYDRDTYNFLDTKFEL